MAAKAEPKVAGKTKSKPKAGGRIRVTLVRGWAGQPKTHLKNLRSLGLRRSGDSRELPDNASVRGAVQSVRHLVSVEDAL
jgi:large subunit ribosomal protein L30